MIMKDCTGTICKMKTYKELKEQVLEENLMTSVNKSKNTATNFVMGTPTNLPRDPDIIGSTSGPTKTERQGGVFGKGGTSSQVGNLIKNNKGLIGGLAVGALGLASLAGIFRPRAPKEVSTKGTVPSPDLQVTKATDAPTTLGVPVKRVSHAAKRIDPSVKPIDNRTTMQA